MEDLILKPIDVVYAEQLLEKQLKINEQEIKIKEQKERERKERVQEEQEKKERAQRLSIRKAKLNEKYGAEIVYLIIDGKVRIGMTADMCIESWGRPSDINKTTGSWGVHEQWVYGSSSYLYFENGILTTIQD